ncbi:unnamed protein product [Bursaphelenchus xylophilus]|uniref:(pine wood nematode) hypothetical protein n=1 Tax=Bursaphelenchus xylophilus TaxID=6326 RepID=A0A1I7RUL6_BURXY|nr:unnamed protein product [Bursaphelenchus xylophilus]CAG9114207.1 unnamed protein product [Bursaphelenchus xylophilus]
MRPRRKRSRQLGAGTVHTPSLSSDSEVERSIVRDVRAMPGDSSANQGGAQDTVDGDLPEYVAQVLASLPPEDRQRFRESYEKKNYTLTFSPEALSPVKSPPKSVQKRPMRTRGSVDVSSRSSEQPSSSSNSRAPSQDLADIILVHSETSSKAKKRATYRRRDQLWKPELLDEVEQARAECIPEGDVKIISSELPNHKWWEAHGDRFRERMLDKRYDVNNLPEIKRIGKKNPLSAEDREKLSKALAAVFTKRKQDEKLAAKAAEAKRRKSRASMDVSEPGPTAKQSNEYEVERILMRKFHRRSNVLWYLIHWKGWSLDDLTWQTEEDVQTAPLKVEEFNSRMDLLDKIKRKVGYRDRVHYPYHRSQTLSLLRLEHFKKLAEWETFLNNINNKHGIANIWIENWADDAREPLKFQYGQRNRITEAAAAIFNDRSVKNFSCAKKCGVKCTRKTCCGTQHSEGMPYKDNILVIDTVQYHAIECSVGCICPKDCPARLIQRGRQVPVILFRTAERGWSIRTAVNIQKNQFVMQYVGEVYLCVNAPADVTYQYIMDTCGSDESVFCIDATNYGNEARWVNHSCDPNLKCVGILASRYDYRYQELCFFAKKNIEAGEELLIDYGHKLNPCHCGALKCRNPPKRGY